MPDGGGGGGDGSGGNDGGGGGGITVEEVAAHDKPGDVWIIVNNKVIDVSEFVHSAEFMTLVGEGMIWICRSRI